MKHVSGIASMLLTIMVALSGYSATLEIENVTITSPYGDTSYTVNNDELNICLDVWYIPGAGPIIKEITTNGESGIIHLTETIHIGSPAAGAGVAIHDWHEQLMVEDVSGAWVPSPDGDGLWWGNYTNDGAFPIVVEDLQAQITIDEPSDAVNIIFSEPLVYCNTVTIKKDILVPAGPRSFCYPPVSSYTFAIYEWPTTIPEPSMMVMVGFGLLALRFRRK